MRRIVHNSFLLCCFGILVFCMSIVAMPNFGDKICPCNACVPSTTISNINNNSLTLRVICNKREFVYKDQITKPHNHIMKLEFDERGINACLETKIALMNSRYNLTKNKIDALDWVFPHINKFVQNIANKTNKDCVDSTIKFYPNRENMFEISKEKDGLVVDIYDIKEQIFDRLKKPNRPNDNIYTLHINPTIIPADIKKSDNLRCTYLRAGFSTGFTKSVDARKNNIALSLKSINGTVLKSGDVFSFNQVVGDRTEKRGYQESKIIVKGRFVEGIGGGVCQVSTTLYNAAIRADMSIVSVRSHSLPISYVPPSFDAMVNSGSSDLKIQNNLKTPVFIKAYTKDDRCCIEFYGEQLKYKIIPESETVDTLPPPDEDEEMVDTEYKYLTPEIIAQNNLVSGDKIKVLNGKGGLLSKGYLNYFDKNGQLLIRKQIRTDKYQPQKGLIAIMP